MLSLMPTFVPVHHPPRPTASSLPTSVWRVPGPAGWKQIIHPDKTAQEKSFRAAGAGVKAARLDVLTGGRTDGQPAAPLRPPRPLPSPPHTRHSRWARPTPTRGSRRPPARETRGNSAPRPRHNGRITGALNQRMLL